jgi:hypothetical protein
MWWLTGDCFAGCGQYHLIAAICGLHQGEFDTFSPCFCDFKLTANTSSRMSGAFFCTHYFKTATNLQ